MNTAILAAVSYMCNAPVNKLLHDNDDNILFMYGV